MRSRPALLFFILAFAITWIVWVPRAVGEAWAEEIGAIWTYGPALAAVVAAAIVGGRAELSLLGRRLLEWRIGLRWYFVILLGPLALALLEAAILPIVSEVTWSESLPSPFTEPLTSTIIFLLILSVTDGVGEELGWRGFAIPHMLKGSSAVTASLVLGVLWAAWHLPLFWTEGSALEGSSIAFLFARLPATAVVYTWLLQHTKGSVLAAALFHGALSVFAPTPPPTGADVTGSIVSVVVWWAAALTVIALARPQRLDQWPRTVGTSDPAQPRDEAGFRRS